MNTSNAFAYVRQEENRNALCEFWEIRPRLFTALAISFACGTALSVAQVDKLFIAIVCVMLTSARIFNVESKLIAMVVGCFLFGVVNAQWRAPHPDSTDLSNLAGEYLQIVACVREVKAGDDDHPTRLLIDCTSVSENCTSQPSAVNEKSIEPQAAAHGCMQVIVWSRNKTDPSYEPGDIVSVQGRITDLYHLNATAQQQRLRYSLGRKGVFSELRTSSSKVIVVSHHGSLRSDAVDKLAGYWRTALVGFHQSALGIDDGNLLASMVLGDRAADPGKEIAAHFQASGLSHVLAASGFNLSVVATSIYFVLRYCSGNLWISNSVCLFGMLGFVAIAGPSPSVMRAFLMGALLLLSRCLGRSLHMPAALCFTMGIVLLIDPWSAADVGFQLSYFSTAGMILGATQFCELLSSKFPKWPEWIRVVLAATLVAQSCVLPLQLYYFKQFTTYCLIANVIVTPMVAPLTILGFASSLLFMLETSLHASNLLSACIDKISFYPLELLRWEVTQIAALPLAQLQTAQAPLASVLLYYAILLLFPILKNCEKLKLWLLLFCMSLAMMFVVLPQSAQPSLSTGIKQNGKQFKRWQTKSSRSGV